MEALPPSRRDLLAAGAAAVSAFSGCADAIGSRSNADGSDDRSDTETGLPDGAITDPAVRTLRTGTTDRIVRHPDLEDRSRFLFLTDETDVEALVFDREPDGTEELESFLTTTAFDEETIVVHQGPVSACYERRVDYLVAESDRFDLRFCRVMREATVDCEATDEHLQATVLRVPVSYDEPPRELTGRAGSSCLSERRERTAESEPDASNGSTDETGGED